MATTQPRPVPPPRRGKLGPAGKGGIALILSGAAILAGMQQTEKQVLYVYPDKLARNLPTFCSGSTSWTAKIGAVFTKRECDDIDSKVAEEYGRAILGCTKVENLNQDIFDSLTLFSINVGKKGACESRAVRLINQGLIKDGCTALRYGPNGQDVWVYANGKFVRGLANRRDFEKSWCLGLSKPVGIDKITYNGMLQWQT